MAGILLERGERGLLVGQTGSGKTQNAIFQLRHACSEPVIIFDTKIEDAFFVLDNEGAGLEVVEGLAALQGFSKKPKKKLPSYLLVRPALEEVQDYNVLSAYALTCYDSFGACFVYFDELYSWHNQGRPTQGMIGLYTRGRSRGKTVLGATQRPAWISRFCLTESQRFYIHALTDGRDRKALGEVIPEFTSRKNPPKHHFHYFEVGGESIPLYAPVPFSDPAAEGVEPFDKKWI